MSDWFQRGLCWTQGFGPPLELGGVDYFGHKEPATLPGTMDKRRSFSDKMKFEVVLEVLTGQRTMAEIASQFEVHPIRVGLWKKEFLERGPSLFSSAKSANDRLSIRRQCELLEISRSSYYYVPRPESEATIKLMNRIDEIFTHNLDYGSRMMRKVLIREDGL